MEETEVWKLVDAFIQGHCLANEAGNRCFKIPSKIWSNVHFHPELGLKPIEQPVKYTTISESYRKSKDEKAAYKRIMLILNEIRLLDLIKERMNKRTLYYKLLSKGGGSMAQIDDAIQIIVTMLGIPRDGLGITASSKGLMKGPLLYMNEEGALIDCTLGTESVPGNVEEIVVDLQAEVVIVVEKDTVFQRIIEEKFLTDWSLVITGKGVPDLNTRKFLRKIAFENPQIPVICLTDGDPYGIEIMFSYKFGSLAMAFAGEPLAVPRLQWFGIKPSEFRDDHHLHKLSQRDEAKLESLLKRPYISSELTEELEIMKNFGKKAEIEDFDSPTNYLWTKLWKSDFMTTLERLANRPHEI